MLAVTDYLDDVMGLWVARYGIYMRVGNGCEIDAKRSHSGEPNEGDERTLPVNGTRWCSQRLLTVISLTRTISSWSSAKIALLITSNEMPNRPKKTNVNDIEFLFMIPFSRERGRGGGRQASSHSVFLAPRPHVRC